MGSTHTWTLDLGVILEEVLGGLSALKSRLYNSRLHLGGVESYERGAIGEMLLVSMKTFSD
jgi:hypothetical protein